MVKPRHKASPAALELIKCFEGCRQTAVPLPGGRWTIGYGHTLTAREGAVVSEADAEALLAYDVRQIAEAIDAVVFTPLGQNQFDALVSFVFNIGAQNFAHSAVLRRINEGAMLEAAFALEMWRKADFEGERIVVDALVRRRAAEKALFLTPDGGWIPAPSGLIEPKADHGLILAAPEGPLAEAAHAAPEAEVALSPVERAAANLAARLEALAPEEPTEPAAPAQPPPAAFPPEPETEPFPGVAAAPAAPFAAPPAAEPAPPAWTPETAEALRRRIYGVHEIRPRAKRARPVSLALLGAVGLGGFIGAVVWAFRTRPTAGVITPVSAGIVAVGLIGIACVATAVYFLLERMAGRGE